MDLNRTLPNNAEAECNLLACLIMEPENIRTAESKLSPDDLYSPQNRKIYETILSLSRRAVVDIQSLATAIRNKELVGYLIALDLENRIPHSLNLAFYISNIRNAAVRREQIKLALRVFNESYNENVDSSESVEALKACIERARTGDETGIVQPSELFDKIDDLYANGFVRGAGTGWIKLDEFYTVRPGEITVISGVPSHGKSSLQTNLMVNIAQESNWKFAVFSPENFPMQRYCAHIAQIYTGQPFSPGYHERMSREVLEAAKYWIDENFIFIIPKSDEMQIDNLIQKAMICVLKHGVKGVVFDPWNEIDHTRPPGLSETEYISKCLSKIRYFARAYQVHVWLVAHPTKMQKNKDGTYPVPTPYDVAGCYSADTEVLTDRGWLLHEKIEEGDKICCFDLIKNNLSYLDFSKKWEYDYQGDMINLKSPSFDLLITPNHRVVVKPDWRDKPSFKNKVKWNGIGRPPTHPIAGWSLVEAQNLKSDLRMPFATKLIDCDDYPITDGELKIIGWWVTEGWGTQGSIAFCQAAGILADEMLEVVKSSGYIFSDKIKRSKITSELPIQVIRLKNRYCKKTKEFTKMILNQCGIGCQNKKLPSFTWQLSSRQKEILFHALMEGDGSKNRGDSFAFATTSRRLVDDIQRLSIELGRMASFSFQNGAREHHKMRYQVNTGQTKRTTITLNMRRHKTLIPYDGKAYCLTVPTGAYITRRNGKVSICGNSAHFRNKADCCLTVWRDLSNADMPTKIYIQKIRFHEIGKVGECELYYNPMLQSYFC